MRRKYVKIFRLIIHVSIHALLAECDHTSLQVSHPQISFNPRTPCGVRQSDLLNIRLFLQFQSTHSLRSATVLTYRLFYLFEVSIHALLAECDNMAEANCPKACCFNPRTPCGVRPGGKGPTENTTCFNPRTPCGVRQASLRRADLRLVVSIHALLAECDRFEQIK